MHRAGLQNKGSCFRFSTFRGPADALLPAHDFRKLRQYLIWALIVRRLETAQYGSFIRPHGASSRIWRCFGAEKESYGHVSQDFAFFSSLSLEMGREKESSLSCAWRQSSRRLPLTQSSAPAPSPRGKLYIGIQDIISANTGQDAPPGRGRVGKSAENWSRNRSEKGALSRMVDLSHLKTPLTSSCPLDRASCQISIPRPAQAGCRCLASPRKRQSGRHRPPGRACP